MGVANAQPVSGDDSKPAPVEGASEPSSDEPVAIRLDHFLQRCGAAMTGGHAKLLIQSGEVMVDHEVETRRRRKLRAGQVVGCGGEEFSVTPQDATSE